VLTVLVKGDACEAELTGTASVAYEPDDNLHTNEETVDAGDIFVPGIDESDANSLADTVMFIVDSSSEESTPPSTCGSSASTSETRKRAAEESPDREREGSSRRDFLGRVTRSAAGCRIYVPPIVDDESDCPGRVLNDDGTFTIRMTLGQGVEDALVSVGGFISTTAPTEEIAEFAQAPGADDKPESSGGDAPLAHEPLFEPAVTFDAPRGPTPATSINRGETVGLIVSSNAAAS